MSVPTKYYSCWSKGVPREETETPGIAAISAQGAAVTFAEIYMNDIGFSPDDFVVVTEDYLGNQEEFGIHGEATFRVTAVGT